MNNGDKIESVPSAGDGQSLQVGSMVQEGSQIAELVKLQERFIESQERRSEALERAMARRHEELLDVIKLALMGKPPMPTPQPAQPPAHKGSLGVTRSIEAELASGEHEDSGLGLTRGDVTYLGSPSMDVGFAATPSVRTRRDHPPKLPSGLEAIQEVLTTRSTASCVWW